MPRALPAEKVQDDATGRIYAALKAAFPELPDDPCRVVYKYNPVAIRVRVISPKFRGKSMAERDAMVGEALAAVPSQVTKDITMLFPLTPGEAKRPPWLVYREFDNPTGEYL